MITKKNVKLLEATHRWFAIGWFSEVRISTELVFSKISGNLFVIRSEGTDADFRWANS